MNITSFSVMLDYLFLILIKLRYIKIIAKILKLTYLYNELIVIIFSFPDGMILSEFEFKFNIYIFNN